MQFHPLPTIVQLRNNCILTYKDTSILHIVRNGCKDSLKQNQKTIYTHALKVLKGKTEIEDVTEYANSCKKLYDSHKDNFLAVKGIDAKEYGTISDNQKRKYKRVVENLVNYIYVNPKTKDYKKGDYCSFLTLTLPSKQVHTDKEINKILVRFLENLKKTKNVLNYVWKAEPQKNGNIHYHILIDKWIDMHYINDRWNSQINKLGYVDRSKSDNPPSTKIHSLGKVKNIVSYIQKYMIKNEDDKRPITAKIFGYSRSAGKLDYPKVIYEGMTLNAQNQLTSLLESNDLKHFDDMEFINMYTGKVYDLLRKKAFFMWKFVKKHYATMKRNLLEFENKFVEVVEEIKEVIKPTFKQLKINY